MIDVIGAAFDSFLQAFTPAMDVAWEGTVYEPQAGRPYLSVKLAAYNAAPAGMGANVAIIENGTYAVNVNWPAGAGRQPPGAVASALAKYFARGVTLARSDGRTITITSSSAAPSTETDGWITIPVLVRFVSDQPN